MSPFCSRSQGGKEVFWQWTVFDLVRFSGRYRFTADKWARLKLQDAYTGIAFILIFLAIVDICYKKGILSLHRTSFWNMCKILNSHLQEISPKLLVEASFLFHSPLNFPVLILYHSISTLLPSLPPSPLLPTSFVIGGSFKHWSGHMHLR